MSKNNLTLPHLQLESNPWPGELPYAVGADKKEKKKIPGRDNKLNKVYAEDVADARLSLEAGLA